MPVGGDGAARFLLRSVLAAWLREYGGGSGGLSDAEFSRRLAALPHGSEVDARRLRACLRRWPSGCPPRGDGLIPTEGDSGAANGPNGDDGSQTS